jgi:hypothetical protein
MIGLGAGAMLRRVRRRETRTEIDIEAEILAKYPNRRITLDDLAVADDDDGAFERSFGRSFDLVGAEAAEAERSWSAAGEAGFGRPARGGGSASAPGTARIRAVASVDLQRDLDPDLDADLDADLVVVADPDDPELEPSPNGGRRSGAARRGGTRRERFLPTGFPPSNDAWDPTRPLPGEPDDLELRAPMRSGARLAERLGERVGDTTHELLAPRRPVSDTPPDAFEMLRRQRDHIAGQVQAAYREVHAVRTDALRRATQAEQHAELAATARERAGRLVREGRRLDAEGRRMGAEAPAPRDSFRQVHEFRVESLKRAAEAEHGAERVAMLREKAARLLAEQRRLEAEMTKHLAQRLR